MIIGISIIIVFFSIPFSKINLDNYKVDCFIREFSNDLRYVRKANQMGNKSVYILVNEYSGAKNGYILKEDGYVLKKNLLPKNSELKCSVEKIIFGKNNTINEDNCTIRIKYNDIYKTLTIVPVSGRVLIKEGIYE